VGVGVSLGLHLPLLVWFSLRLGARSELVSHTDTVPGPAVSPRLAVRVTPLRLPPSPARGVVATLAFRPSVAAPPPAAARPARTRAPDAAGPKPAAAPAPARLHAREPASTTLEPPAALAGREILAGLTASTGVPSAFTLASGPRPGRPGGAHPGGNGELTAGAAAYLRTYETFPSLPDTAWSWSERRHVFSLRVCVTGRGQVGDVLVDPGPRRDLGAFLAAAVRTWRYRPWLIAGSPRPFCHPLRITYSRG
jgi:hypothetical protein